MNAFMFRNLPLVCLSMLVLECACSESGTSECTVDTDCPGTEICLGGSCTDYDPCEGIVCKEGEVCVFGSCVPETCTDTSCIDPPGHPACYDLPARCEGGVCSYEPVIGRGCDDGDECTRDDVCREQGACAGLPLICDDPPSPVCKDAQTLLVHASPGQCTGGECKYSAVEVECPQGCAGGECGGDPCEGVVCDDPPPSECVSASVVRIYSSPGACSSGVCGYPFDDTYCPHGCENGSCLGDSCEGVVCNDPPDDICVDNHTLRQYSASGICVGGKCEYSFDEVHCDHGCSGGGCLGCTPNWVDTSECSCTSTECEGCSGTKQQSDGCGNTRQVPCSLPPTGCSGPCCAAECCEPSHVCHNGSCCTPEGSCPQGYECGLAPDGCGGTLECGTCTGCAGSCVSHRCEPVSRDHLGCLDGDVYWFDSCGSPENMAEDCPEANPCHQGACADMACDGGACLPNGIISYHGAVIDSEFVSWLYMLDDWPSYRNHVVEHFCDIRVRYHARAVRLLVHTEHKGWTGDPGMVFPQPAGSQLEGLRDIIDTAVESGLEVVLVVLMPSEYRTRHPDDPDDFYAGNGLPLQSNLFSYWTALFNGTLGSTGPDGKLRAEHVMFVDIIGDFDPNNVYGHMTSEEQDNHREWFRRIWPAFHAWFDYIPNEKKSFELIGGVGNPAMMIEDQIAWVKGELAAGGFPEPAFYSFEAYACVSWVEGYATWWDAYRDLFARAAAAAGGLDRIVVEEIGVNRCADCCTNDGAEGEMTFSAALAALHSLDPGVPVGIWVYHDSPSCSANGLWGLTKADGSPVAGWWVVPYYFGQ